MSQTKNIATVDEVSSLATTDTVLAEQGGSVKRISVANLNNVIATNTTGINVKDVTITTARSLTVETNCKVSTGSLSTTSSYNEGGRYYYPLLLGSSSEATNLHCYGDFIINNNSLQNYSSGTRRILITAKKSSEVSSSTYLSVGTRVRIDCQSDSWLSLLDGVGASAKLVTASGNVGTFEVTSVGPLILAVPRYAKIFSVQIYAPNGKHTITITRVDGTSDSVEL